MYIVSWSRCSAVVPDIASLLAIAFLLDKEKVAYKVFLEGNSISKESLNCPGFDYWEV